MEAVRRAYPNTTSWKRVGHAARRRRTVAVWCRASDEDKRPSWSRTIVSQAEHRSVRRVGLRAHEQLHASTLRPRHSRRSRLVIRLATAQGRERGHDYDMVRKLLAERVRRTEERISAKRLLPTGGLRAQRGRRATSVAWSRVRSYSRGGVIVEAVVRRSGHCRHAAHRLGVWRTCGEDNAAALARPLRRTAAWLR